MTVEQLIQDWENRHAGIMKAAGEAFAEGNEGRATKLKNRAKVLQDRIDELKMVGRVSPDDKRKRAIAEHIAKTPNTAGLSILVEEGKGIVKCGLHITMPREEYKQITR